jgi:hypothetical protein
VVCDWQAQRRQRVLPRKPFGRRSFCPRTLSLVGQISSGYSPSSASRPEAKFLAATCPIIRDLASPRPITSELHEISGIDDRYAMHEIGVICQGGFDVHWGEVST